MIRKMSARGSSVAIHFGSTRVERFTETFPCRVFRVVATPGGAGGASDVRHEEIRRVLKAASLDRAVREAGRGWQSNALDQWAEVRPDDWRPGVML